MPATAAKRAINAKSGRRLGRAGILPRHGPYATAHFVNGQWVVKLNARGQALVAETLAKYPRVYKMLASKSPRMLSAIDCVRGLSRHAAEEIEAAAIGGVCQAATYFDPGESQGNFESFAAFHVRAWVSKELERFNSWREKMQTLPPDDRE